MVGHAGSRTLIWYPAYVRYDHGGVLRMIYCTDEEAGIKPFHEWKAELYGKLQTEGRAYDKEWYYRKYGEYCNQMRRIWNATQSRNTQHG